MISFNNVSRHYGTQEVLTNVSCEILPGRKIGLIGPNGAGKTTFVRILAGEEESSSGSVSRAPGLRIGLVPQQVNIDPGLTVEGYLLEEYRSLEADLRAQETALSSVSEHRMPRALAAYQRARDAFDAAGGEDAPRRVEGMLDGLGLAGTMERTVGSLSGGERNVLSLAKALMGRPTLLVLDEPGNHLDFSGLAWLERFLQNFDGALLIVSHNRYLLDRVVDSIFELENTRLSAYAGNYSGYRLQRLRRLVTQQADYVANQKRLSQLEALVEKFAQIARTHHDPAWGRRLHSRKTQLEREKKQAVEKPTLTTARIAPAIVVERTRADIALQVNGHARRFGDRILFSGARLSIACGERVALVGPNGSGKTTFLNDVVRTASWNDARLRIGPSLSVGYCAQHQETLDYSHTVLDEFLKHGMFTRKEVFSALSRFLFRWEDLDKGIGDLSGGEKNRLQLARVMMLKANFLILDEPTNHMDIASCEAIEESLSSFSGTILIVSHDRYLLDKVAQRIIEIDGGKFVPYAGSFSEFWEARKPFLLRGNGRVLARGKQLGKDRVERAGSRANGRAAEIERRIVEREVEKRSVERDIVAAFADGDHQRGKLLTSRLDRVSRLLDDLYDQWAKCGD